MESRAWFHHHRGFFVLSNRSKLSSGRTRVTAKPNPLQSRLLPGRELQMLDQRDGQAEVFAMSAPCLGANALHLAFTLSSPHISAPQPRTEGARQPQPGCPGSRRAFLRHCTGIIHTNACSRDRELKKNGGGGGGDGLLSESRSHTTFKVWGCSGSHFSPRSSLKRKVLLFLFLDKLPPRRTSRGSVLPPRLEPQRRWTELGEDAAPGREERMPWTGIACSSGSLLPLGAPQSPTHGAPYLTAAASCSAGSQRG